LDAFSGSALFKFGVHLEVLIVPEHGAYGGFCRVSREVSAGGLWWTCLSQGFADVTCGWRFIGQHSRGEQINDVINVEPAAAMVLLNWF